MQHSAQIAPGVWWLGVNDRRKELFENIWPLLRGVSYNSYLIDDRKSALLDTLEEGSDGSYIERIEQLLGDRKELDYLIVNHMELDHAGQIEAVLRRWPEARVVGNAQTLKILSAYYGERATARFLQVADGEVIDLGRRKLQFFLTPWLHWPETMMTYETTEKILFPADAFGTFGTIDGVLVDPAFSKYEEEMRRYYSNIVGKYSLMVQKALAKLAGLPIDTLCSLHGPVWKRHASEVIGLYDRLSRYEGEAGVMIAYASMYDNTARLADHIALQLTESGVNEIVVHDVSKTHLSHILSDAWRYRGVMLGSCAYNSGMFPLMESLCRELKNSSLKARALGLFGGYSFNGGGVRSLLKWAEEMPWEQVGQAVELHGRPTSEKLAAADALCAAMAAAISKK